MRLKTHFSTVGLLTGTLFFSLSLTPTLLPRTEIIQGIISGLSLLAGYGVGVSGHWLYRYLELRTPGERIQRLIRLGSACICVFIAVIFLWRANEWQRELRALMGLEEAGPVHPVYVGVIAFSLFTALLLVAKLFRRTFQFLSTRLQIIIPRRVSHLVGLVAAFILFWSILDGVIFKMALRAADRSYQEIDALIEPEFEQPADPLKTGSPVSLVNWEEMGRQGRRFIARSPEAIDLAAFSNSGHSLSPLRVYVGANSADTPEERARLALEELKRVNAFDRSILALITPTGTGWVDPNAVDTVEYLHRGDIASVAVQYSYLPSHLSLMLEGEYGAETARAVFREIYGHWTSLPHDSRPKLFLHGLSLGALNSDLSFELYDIIEDPFHGVLWSGPPFRSDTWRTVTDQREPDSPAWLPRFRSGSVVRFANQNTGLDAPDTEWGSFRIAFLQYASDPVTFFEPGSLYREPDWMSEPRGPDVSPDLRWFPIVTWLQLAADMAAGSSPPGFGHNYTAGDYLEAWLALTEPEGWSEEGLQRLRRHFADMNR